MRLFIAFQTNEAVIGEVVRLQRILKRKYKSRISWVGDEQMHLTLRFLDEQEEGNLSALKEAMELMASRMRPVKLRLSNISSNPPFGHLRVIWIVPEEEQEEGLLVKNYTVCNEALQGIVNLPEKENRPYLPHITVGRVHRDNREQKEIRASVEALRVEPVEFKLDSVTLFSSELGHGGAVHKSLGVYPLQGKE